MTQNPEPQPHAAAGPTPPPPFYPYWTPPPEEEANLLDLLAVLRKGWKLTAAFTLAGTALAVSYAALATPIYRANAVIAPPPKKDLGAASTALAAVGGLGAEIAGTLGFSIGSSDSNRLEALLKSHRLMERTVTKHALLPVLFDDQWDAVNKKWTVVDQEDIPNIWDAKEEMESIYIVKNDIKAGVLRISFDWKDPKIAEGILGFLLTELSVILQEDEVRRIEVNRAFAEERLKDATDPVIIAKLQTLLSDQVEKAMMARNVESFAYELLDAPVASDVEEYPNRPLVVAVGVGVGLFAGLAVALIRGTFPKRRPPFVPA